MERLTGSLAPGRGIGLTVIGMGVITLNDAVSKWLTQSYPVGEVLFVRGLFTVIPILILAWRAGGLHTLRVKSHRAQSLRGIFFVVGTFFFFYSLSFLPLAQVIAISFTNALFMTALAIPLLGERVGWRRWSAVGIGFLGVLVMIRPGGEAFRWVLLLPIINAAFDALTAIVTRRLCQTETTVATLWYTNWFVVGGALLTLPLGWHPVSPGDLALFLVAAVFGGVGNYLMVEAYRWAEVSLIAPFRYTALVWAVLYGFLFWGDVPDAWMAGGAVIVIGSGLYIAGRARRARAVSGAR